MAKRNDRHVSECWCVTLRMLHAEPGVAYVCLASGLLPSNALKSGKPGGDPPRFWLAP